MIIDWEAEGDAATAEADRMYPPEPPRAPNPIVRAEMLKSKLSWLRWWSRLTGADVRADIEYWKRIYGE